MTNLLFEIEIHSGGQFERNPELVYLGGKVSTYCKVDPDRLSYFEIQDMVAECGVEPLQVVGQSDFGGVVDEGDELESDEVEGDYFSTGDELEGDEGNVFEGDELNELVSYDWMNDGLKGANFVDDIFGGNEDEDDNEVVGNGRILQVMLSHQCRLRFRAMGGIMQMIFSYQCSLRLGVMGGIMHSLGLGATRVIMHSLRIRVRQYAPSTTRPNQLDVQEPDWTEPGIEDYEIHTGAISDDEDPRDRAPEFNQQTDMRKPDLVLGMKFPNSRVFREALREYVVNKAVDIKFKLNEKTKISVHCKNDLNSSYVARKYLQDFGKNPKWEVARVQHHVRQDISVELSRNQVYRAKRKAREMLEGDEKLQYSTLWDYTTMIRKTNVGSKVYIKCDCSEDGGQPRFLRMYVRYHAQKVGFLASCRPIIGLNGCHLKGRFGGQLLATTARDGNDNIFPIAVAVVEQECKESWIWFLKHFFEDIGDPQDLNLVFISDRQKGLVPAFKKLFPKVEHRIGMEKYGGSVCPNVQDKLEKLKMEGIPCKHGVEAIYKNLEHLKDYLHDCYLKEAYLDVYSEIIHPMPGQDEWIKSGHLPPQPQHVFRPPRRPKKLRRRDPDEPRNPPQGAEDASSGAGRGRGATCGIGSGAGSGVGSGAGKGRGATYGASRGRGSNSGAGMGSTSSQSSGASRGSISGQVSGASRS
uniref:Uncharacterized protein n=1 Tax=Fagus sylvatica TaxID=28930 RepID=A0A2N9GDS7_FAGSY